MVLLLSSTVVAVLVLVRYWPDAGRGAAAGRLALLLMAAALLLVWYGFCSLEICPCFVEAALLLVLQQCYLLPLEIEGLVGGLLPLQQCYCSSAFETFLDVTALVEKCCCWWGGSSVADLFLVAAEGCAVAVQQQ